MKAPSFAWSRNDSFISTPLPRERAQSLTTSRGGDGPAVRAARGAVLAAAFVSSWTGVKALPGFSLPDVAIIVAFCACLYAAPTTAARGFFRTSLTPVAVTVVLLYAVQGIAAGGAPLPRAATSSTTVLIRVLLVFVVLPALVYFVVHHPKWSGYLVVSWASGLSVNGLVAEFFVLTNLQGKLPVLQQIQTDRATGLSEHPNTLAEGLTLALPILLTALLRARSSGLVLAAVAAVGGCIVGLVESDSRAGIIIGGIIIVLVVPLELSRSRAGVRGGVAFIVAASIAAIIGGSTFISATRFASQSGDVSSDGRAASIGKAWEVFLGSPILGSTIGVWYGELIPLILLTSGGLVLFAVYYFSLARILARAISSRVDEHLVVAVAVVVVWGLFNNAVFERYVYWIPFVVEFSLLSGLASRGRGKRLAIRG